MIEDRFKANTLFLPVILFLFLAVGFAGPVWAQTGEAATEGVKVEKISETRWNIINKNGEFVGILESEGMQTFKIYYTDGMFVGVILGSGVLQPRLYRSRSTTIQPDEARLYLDALDAIELIK